MRANSICISCLLSKQEQQISAFSDEQKKSQYIQKILELLRRNGQTQSSPQLAEQINHLYQNFWGQSKSYAKLKQQFNQLLLEKEQEIENEIRLSDEIIKTCIQYVCAANYIDFSAVENVNARTLEQLLVCANTQLVDKAEYRFLIQDLQTSRSLVYLTDNCGEIVLDKIFIKLIKELYPHLQITVIVRGENVLNDATYADAQEVGLTDIVTCIGNGNGAPGTVLERLDAQAKQLLLNADLIISKGQGNFESLFGEGLNPYYLFLCKCELFVRRFGIKQFQHVFIKEERVKLQTAETSGDRAPN